MRLLDRLRPGRAAVMHVEELLREVDYAKDAVTYVDNTKLDHVAEVLAHRGEPSQVAEYLIKVNTSGMEATLEQKQTIDRALEILQNGGTLGLTKYGDRKRQMRVEPFYTETFDSGAKSPLDVTRINKPGAQLITMSFKPQLGSKIVLGRNNRDYYVGATQLPSEFVTALGYVIGNHAIAVGVINDLARFNTLPLREQQLGVPVRERVA